MQSTGRTSAERCAIRATVLLLAASVTWGCTSSVSSLDTASAVQPGFAPDAVLSIAGTDLAESAPAPETMARTANAEVAPAPQTVAEAAGLPLPDPATAETASVPVPSDAQPVQVAETVTNPAEVPVAVAAASPASVPEQVPSSEAANARILAAANAPTAGGGVLQAAEGVQATLPPEQVVALAAPQVEPPKAQNKPGFLNALFRDRSATRAKPAPVQAQRSPVEQMVAAAASRPPSAQIQPGFQAVQGTIVAKASAIGSNSELPGFDRKRALGIVEEEQPEGVEDEVPLVRVASAAGLARLAPNGLRTQHANVDVACLKPALVRVLKQIERHYGRPVVVTSGYRSPSRNAAARGAKNSLHMYCAAADVQVAGVSKWDLAAYVRTMPGRGGVGTYCHTESVHVDIGPTRDWNWRCRRKK